MSTSTHNLASRFRQRQDRSPFRKVEPHILDHFAAMRRAVRHCTCPVRDVSGWSGGDLCRACVSFWQHHAHVHQYLDLPVARWPGLLDPATPPPYAEGTAAHARWLAQHRDAMTLWIYLTRLLAERERRDLAKVQRGAA